MIPYYKLAKEQDIMLLDSIKSSNTKEAHWLGLHGASLGLALAELLDTLTTPCLIVTPDTLSLEHLLDELSFFQSTKKPLFHYPDWETLPYDHFSPHQDIISERLTALDALTQTKNGVMLTTVSNLMHRVAPTNYLAAHRFNLKIGDQLNLDELKKRLVSAGYRHVTEVALHGEFAIRGSIIDLFAMGSDTPFRIDLFDNEIESIRTFSTDTQRTLEKVTDIHLLPAKEFPLTEEAIDLFRQSFRSQFGGNPANCALYQDVTDGIASPGLEYYLPLFFNETAALFDYLPQNTLIVCIDPYKKQADQFWKEVALRYEQYRYDVSKPILSPDALFLSPEKLNASLSAFSLITINEENKKKHAEIFDTSPTPSFEPDHHTKAPLSALADFLISYDGRVLFCAETIGRREVLLQLFKNGGMTVNLTDNWQSFLSSHDKYAITIAPLEESVLLASANMMLITETQLFGKRVMQRRRRQKLTEDNDALIRNLTELQFSDPVVHIHHGIGRYLGLETLTVGDQIAEFLCLEYQGQAKLYVPVASLHLITRYTGADAEHIIVNRLGTDQWEKAKRKAIEKIHDVAAELLDLHAKRAAREGHRYELDETAYQSFAASFPFEETPDQLQAIDQIIKDLQSDKPMDRVVCGDVGFGKTEVAIRAAFIAVQNHKQAAVLVPTTLLAQQHFETFQNRFADWPIQIEMLSRFKTKKEQEDILKKLASGSVDIIIGTHALLQPSVKYKNLSLIIIDEEHRFGVKQKEMFKAMRAEIDILTLTATPIPRTLNMALSGLRDLSVIATPPAKRLSVKTFIHEYQDGLVKEAIQREILRGGQVYFLHNDVSTIRMKADEIARLIPEARVNVGHGQLHERELERVMSDFYHRRFNVLVCSTIIESGIDVPSANTIIINRADKFGIAQLHQLRGRVGRSHHQAYAYLFVPHKKNMTNDALKRLDAIGTLGELGIGFTLATHDLEIRGTGELLGEEQSGEMHAIGFTLYMELLSRAVDALKSGAVVDLNDALLYKGSEVDLHIPALIPESYIGDVALRLQFYKRIANAQTEDAINDIQIEMIDRFGLIPEPLKNLFSVTELKLRALSLGITKIEANHKGGKFEFNEKTSVKPEKIITLIQNRLGTYKLDGSSRLKFTLPEHEVNERIKFVTARLEALL